MEAEQVEQDNLRHQVEQDYAAYLREKDAAAREALLQKWLNDKRSRHTILEILFDIENKTNPGDNFLRPYFGTLTLHFIEKILPDDPAFKKALAEDYTDKFLALMTAHNIDQITAATFSTTRNNDAPLDESEQPPEYVRSFFARTTHPLLNSTILDSVVGILSIAPSTTADNIYHRATWIVADALAAWWSKKVQEEKPDNEMTRSNFIYLKQNNPSLETGIKTKFSQFQEQTLAALNDLKLHTAGYMAQLDKEIDLQKEEFMSNNRICIAFTFSLHNNQRGLIQTENTFFTREQRIAVDKINDKIKFRNEIQDLYNTLANPNPELTAKVKLQHYADKLFQNYGNKLTPSLAEKIEKHSGNKTFVNVAIVTLSAIVVIPAVILMYYRYRHHHFPWEKEGKGAINEVKELRDHTTVLQR